MGSGSSLLSWQGRDHAVGARVGRALGSWGSSWALLPQPVDPSRCRTLCPPHSRNTASSLHVVLKPPFSKLEVKEKHPSSPQRRGGKVSQHRRLFFIHLFYKTFFMPLSWCSSKGGKTSFPTPSLGVSFVAYHLALSFLVVSVEPDSKESHFNTLLHFLKIFFFIKFIYLRERGRAQEKQAPC